MNERRAEVRNAADPKQVRGATQREQRREERRLGFYLETMSSVAGRAVMWDLLGRMGLYGSPLHPQGSMLYYNVGRQDFARELLAEIVALADGTLYAQMEAEARARGKADANETDAANTPRAEESENGTDGR